MVAEKLPENIKHQALAESSLQFYKLTRVSVRRAEIAVLRVVLQSYAVTSRYSEVAES